MNSGKEQRWSGILARRSEAETGTHDPGVFLCQAEERRKRFLTWWLDLCDARKPSFMFLGQSDQLSHSVKHNGQFLPASYLYELLTPSLRCHSESRPFPSLTSLVPPALLASMCQLWALPLANVPCLTFSPLPSSLGSEQRHFIVVFS